MVRNMIPLALRLTNFRSVQGTQTFHFPAHAGLYFMQGVNALEPRLEANGAGKTTIWEALTWCWFGKTSRGLKAGEVCNWDAEKGTSVDFIFLHDRNGEPCKLSRTWGPNSWTLHTADNDETQDLVKEKDNPALSWLALSFEPWLNSILTAQGQPMFLDMKRDAQAALFSDVMGLDRWLDYSARASKAAAEQDRKSRDLERELAKLEGELEAHSKQDFRESSDQWERKQRAKLEEVTADYEHLMLKRNKLKKDMEWSADVEADARAVLTARQPDEGAQKDLGVFRGYAADYASYLTEEQVKRDAVHSHLDHLEKEQKCPTCGQGLGKAAWFEEMRKAERALVAVNQAIAKWERELAGAKARVEKLETQTAGQQRDADAARTTLHIASQNAASDRRAYDLNERELDRIEEESENIQAERNPYADMEEKARATGRALRLEIEHMERKLDAGNGRLALLQFWVRGFKEVRLGLISEALTELEIEVNSCCDALGLIGWELQFQVDRETKGGGIQRGFNCFVRSPHNDTPVPWEAWSGGEAQRLRLAATMGLADLIRSRTSTSLALEVWDEPTSGLSAQGIRDLLECLAERAVREKRQIWIVDHRAHDFGGFAGGAVITKTAKGSAFATYY